MAIHASSAATSLPYCTHRLDSTTVAASISNSTHRSTTSNRRPNGPRPTNPTPHPDAISSRSSGAKIHEDSGAKTLDDTHPIASSTYELRWGAENGNLSVNGSDVDPVWPALHEIDCR